MKKCNIAQISFLIACGSVLQLAEGLFALPVPGIKIGLANITSLVALVLFGAPAGFEVAVFRPVITSLTNGTFLSPGFMLSLCGSIVSFAAMAGMYAVFGTRQRRVIIAISIAGAVTHNLTEVTVAYFWLVRHKGVFALAPLLMVPAIIGGYVVGWSSNYVLARFAEFKLNAFFSLEREDENIPVPGALAFKDKVKILAAFCMVLSTVFVHSWKAYAVLILAVAALILFDRKTMPMKIGRLFRLWGVICFSFALPVIFSPAGPVVFAGRWVTITEPGLYQGTLFAMRLVFLIFISIWMGVSEPSKLSQELAWILSPLKYFHFSVDRIPRMTSLSLSFIPVIWEKLARVKPKTLRTILDALADFLMGLDQQHAGVVTPAASSLIFAAGQDVPPLH